MLRGLLGNAAKGRGFEREARQAAGAQGAAGGKGWVASSSSTWARPSDALVAQRGKGGGADGRVVVDGDADEHVAGHLRVKPDALHLAHGHAPCSARRPGAAAR